MSDKYNDLIKNGKNKLETDFSDSLMNSGKFLVGVVTTLSAIAGGMHLFNKFTYELFITFILIASIFFILSVFLFEIRRLKKIEKALATLLDVDKDYELIIADIRIERDSAKEKITELETKNAMMSMLNTALIDIKNTIAIEINKKEKTND